MSDKSFTKLVKDVKVNRFANPVIEYTVIDGTPFIVRGNNRFFAARHLGRLDELTFQRVDVPVPGTSFKTEQDVLGTVGTVRQPIYRGVR